MKGCDAIQFQNKNFFFSIKTKKSTLGLILHVSSSATRDGKGYCMPGYYLVANLPIINRIVNILLEPVTLKPLFRWIPNLAQLYLATRGNFFDLEKWRSFNVIQYRRKNRLFIEKPHKFLQETHSNSKVAQKWKEDFKGHVFFSHGKTSSCGVLTAYFGKETFTFNKSGN